MADFGQELTFSDTTLYFMYQFTLPCSLSLVKTAIDHRIASEDLLAHGLCQKFLQ